MPRKAPGIRLMKAAESSGLITAREAADFGYHPEVLRRAVREGQLERIARGTYRTPDHEPSAHHGLVVAALAVPRGVICLLSALAFHQIGTQLPAEVWMAIDRRDRRPALQYPPVHVVRFSGSALTAGVETHRIDGRDVHVYSGAKTIADCFKYRNKIGLDVAIEALNSAWRDRRVSLKEINQHARVCRVHNVMRPYLEAITS
jgi:predicted transcriptional regulator of viral defense system